MSEIDFSRLRSLTARQIVRALRRDGFEMERQTGGHRQYYHRDGENKGYCGLFTVQGLLTLLGD